jgi:hypothetical protein
MAPKHASGLTNKDAFKAIELKRFFAALRMTEHGGYSMSLKEQAG